MKVKFTKYDNNGDPIHDWRSEPPVLVWVAVFCIFGGVHTLAEIVLWMVSR